LKAVLNAFEKGESKSIKVSDNHAGMKRMKQPTLEDD